MPVKDEGMIMTPETNISIDSCNAFYSLVASKDWSESQKVAALISWKAAISSVSTGKIEGWKLTTGHGVKLVETKPQCDIDCWQPLFTHQPDQSARIAELQLNSDRYNKLKSFMLPEFKVAVKWLGSQSDWTPDKDHTYVKYTSWEILESELDKLKETK